jgi:hypothetical protein
VLQQACDTLQVSSLTLTGIGREIQFAQHRDTDKKLSSGPECCASNSRIASGPASAFAA